MLNVKNLSLRFNYIFYSLITVSEPGVLSPSQKLGYGFCNSTSQL